MTFETLFKLSEELNTVFVQPCGRTPGGDDAALTKNFSATELSFQMHRSKSETDNTDSTSTSEVLIRKPKVLPQLVSARECYKGDLYSLAEMRAAVPPFFLDRLDLRIPQGSKYFQIVKEKFIKPLPKDTGYAENEYYIDIRYCGNDKHQDFSCCDENTFIDVNVGRRKVRQVLSDWQRRTKPCGHYRILEQDWMTKGDDGKQTCNYPELEPCVTTD
eukprot:GHVP01010112.1.p1 GENE.GHVP01010112.1~~GHVP01010112.1.p1  ORF type:complete len:217 (+),score=7.00 GHVP01010112.1:35-685(+)